MSLPSINFLHLMVSEIYSGKNLKVMVTTARSKFKSRSHNGTSTPRNQCPYQVSTFYTLRFLRYRLDNIFKLKVTMARSNKCHTMTLYTHTPPTNVSTMYQLPTPYDFLHIAQKNLFPSPTHPSIRTLWVKTIPTLPTQLLNNFYCINRLCSYFILKYSRLLNLVEYKYISLRI